MVTAPISSNPREAFRAATSVALAVLVARLLQLPDIWWVAFSAFMVARPGFFITLQRGVFRILGTMAGAVAAVWLAALLVDHTMVFVLFMFASSVPTLYLTLVSRYGYGWLFAAITIDMVLASAHLNPGGVAEFAWLRVLDVVVGTLAALVVSFAFDHGNSLRRAGWRSAWVELVPTRRVAPDRALDGLRLVALRHATEGALAIAILGYIAFKLEIDAFGQAAVTVLAVMTLPLSQMGNGRRRAVTSKLGWRLLGCLAGGGVGLLADRVVGPFQPGWWLGLYAGVWATQWLQDSFKRSSYFGTQACLGFLTAFVQDAGTNGSASGTTERFVGSVCGCAMMGLILLAGRLVEPRREASTMPASPPQSDPGE